MPSTCVNCGHAIMSHFSGKDRCGVFNCSCSTTTRLFVAEHLQSQSDNLNEIMHECHKRSLDAGWYHNPITKERLERNVPEMLCLIHSEISEALEGYRKNLNDDKLPHRKMIEVELADALIRIADLAGYLGLDLGGAYVEKLLYNETRSDHKSENRVLDGGKKF